MIKNKKIFIVLLIILFIFTSCKDSPRHAPDEKPVIYLYPNEETKVNVRLDYLGDLICTYPSYPDEGWTVAAQPDGTLINIEDNREYSYLFWEGNSNYEWKINKGFVIEGKDTMEFLQDKLEYMGLSPREYNEFIVYWLPRMKDNKYNLIYFAEDEYESLSQLSIEPEPDNIIRVFMVFKALDNPIDIEEQELKSNERNGFTVVEWGGTEIN